jgi:hypothetical protein
MVFPGPQATLLRIMLSLEAILCVRQTQLRLGLKVEERGSLGASFSAPRASLLSIAADSGSLNVGQCDYGLYPW